MGGKCAGHIAEQTISDRSIKMMLRQACGIRCLCLQSHMYWLFTLPIYGIEKLRQRVVW